MDDHLKQAGIWAGVGAAVGVGLAIGFGMRLLAMTALAGLGAGAALGIASGAKRRTVQGPGASQPLVESYEAPAALH
ncbi:hypothetical protein [Phenylobacterium deserti]|uniref:Uncharacterized protein n=1 Tax=Phenylobacterium deserti TaxID=1914756 RepID=A0A328A9Z5_9CAUL|nr:hypothetical protein [Phenylobacterium deserti]RAK51411.1 hypothetical protein DJ018_15855 [Phenylobacterium deserti]